MRAALDEMFLDVFQFELLLEIRNDEVAVNAVLTGIDICG